MTLNDIYEWIVKNIQYFKNDSDTNSSVAWKNSVRHNLSLHPIFQKEAPVAVGLSKLKVNDCFREAPVPSAHIGELTVPKTKQRDEGERKLCRCKIYNQQEYAVQRKRQAGAKASLRWQKQANNDAIQHLTMILLLKRMSLTNRYRIQHRRQTA